MARPPVYEVGHVETIGGTRIHVGVDHGLVRLRGDGLLNPGQQESFAQLFVRACWLAGQQDGLVAAPPGEISRNRGDGT